jgi:hypothetical protein
VRRISTASLLAGLPGSKGENPSPNASARELLNSALFSTRHQDTRRCPPSVSAVRRPWLLVELPGLGLLPNPQVQVHASYSRTGNIPGPSLRAAFRRRERESLTGKFWDLKSKPGTRDSRPNEPTSYVIYAMISPVTYDQNWPEARTRAGAAQLPFLGSNVVFSAGTLISRPYGACLIGFWCAKEQMTEVKSQKANFDCLYLF